MPRTKNGKVPGKKRSHAVATDILLRNARRQAQTTANSTPVHLTMREEARNTGGRSLWRPGSLLRHQAVQFVSAGELRPADHESPFQIPKVDMTTDVSRIVTQKKPATSLLEADSSTVNDSAPFFIDSKGETTPQTGMPDPIIHIASDESSEDEIVFHGRQKRNGPNVLLLNDPTTVQNSAHNTGRRNNQKISNLPVTDSVETPVKNRAAASNSCRPILHTVTDSYEDAGEHADTKKQQPEKQYAENIFDSDFDAYDDYLSNIDHVYYHKDSPEQEPAAVLATQEADYQRAAEDSREQTIRNYHKKRISSEDEESIGTPETPAHGKSSSRSLSDHDKESQSSEAYDSGSDVDLSELDVLEELSIQDRKQRDPSQLRLTKHKGSTFPPATAFADALELDPYYGFDIMDFDRPSLRRKSKTRRHAADFGLSDPELEMELVRAWQNDREAKKLKKQRRAELRSRGLLGRGLDNPDLKAKYGKGMSLEELKTEMHAFFQSPRNSLPLPPMPKQRRKMIHDLASALSLNSKSRGKGAFRFPILHKTSRTPGYSTSTVAQINRLLSAGSSKPKKFDHNVKFSNNRHGQLGGSVSYMDGDIVGASAPEIGAGNKGRAMLEKMGWSTGTALGATNNKGILLPVAHVVKNSKAGLG